jgi:hypothetical protein
VPVSDLTHLPEVLQKTALWVLADGGFESRISHGVFSRGAHDIDVTAFDLETLRERRGEWAFLDVDRPFRIAGTLSVVACDFDRDLGHLLLRHVGHGDELEDDNALERGSHIHKAVRDSLGVPRKYPADPPKALTKQPIDVALPEGWRAYGKARDQLVDMLGKGFGPLLERASRRDLVVEIVGSLVIVYPATREVAGADAYADLTATALTITEAVLATTRPLSPRGVESSTTAG